MSVNAKRNYEKLVNQLMHSMVVTGIEDLNENPLAIQEYLERIAHSVADKYIHEHYDWLVFDSPMGFRSESYIQLKLGLIAKWEGQTGHRGTTTVYLPKDKYSCAEEVKVALDMLYTLNKKEKQQNLFDEHSELKFFHSTTHTKGVKNGMYSI